MKLKCICRNNQVWHGFESQNGLNMCICGIFFLPLYLLIM